MVVAEADRLERSKNPSTPRRPPRRPSASALPPGGAPARRSPCATSNSSHCRAAGRRAGTSAAPEAAGRQQRLGRHPKDRGPAPRRPPSSPSQRMDHDAGDEGVRILVGPEALGVLHRRDARDEAAQRRAVFAAREAVQAERVGVDLLVLVGVEALLVAAGPRPPASAPRPSARVQVPPFPTAPSPRARSPPSRRSEGSSGRASRRIASRARCRPPTAPAGGESSARLTVASASFAGARVELGSPPNGR